MKAKDLFTESQKNLIKKAIERAELNTSGEIRVYIENVCLVDVLDRAAFIFKKLKMHNTKLRNGTLIYLAVKQRKFAIIGDSGINSTVPVTFWDDIKLSLIEYFRKDQFTEGLVKGIEMAGEHLKKHFPYQDNDINELSNEIAFGKN